MSQPPDDFMTADLAWISEWLLETATSMVESECEARGCSDWQLLQRRQEIASPRVQRALDILVASGFIAAPTDEDHETAASPGNRWTWTEARLVGRRNDQGQGRRCGCLADSTGPEADDGGWRLG